MAGLIALIEPHYPKGKTGRPQMGIATMLRIPFLQQWFGLSDPAMEEALHDVPLYREFADLEGLMRRLPDESTILRFRHLLEEHGLAAPMLATVNRVLQERGLRLKTGTVVDATLIAAPSSTKNSKGQRDPEMRQTKKGNNYYEGGSAGALEATRNQAGAVSAAQGTLGVPAVAVTMRSTSAARYVTLAAECIATRSYR